MFLNYIKVFFAKKALNKYLQDVKFYSLPDKIKSVGLLVDESDFFEKDALINDLVANGFDERNIQTIVFTDEFKKNSIYTQPTFGLVNLNLDGTFNEIFLENFVKKEFDLLINFYDVNKVAPMLVTLRSKAKFKVGFDSVDSRLNQLIIKSEIKKQKEFVSELFKYLRILNKI